MSKRKKALRPGKKRAAVHSKVTVSRGRKPEVSSKNSEDIDRNLEKDNQHNRDISSKTVFGNAVLCAQFLRDNFDMPVLKDVQPEDIEDISERFYPYLGSEFEADSVKKIRILDIEKNRKDGGKEPPFLVSLIEHKSLVDYDVSMQLLRYMVCIWTEYRREKEAEKEGCTRQKGFRYPVIIPIVYYEGKAEWTAGMHLSDRIGGDAGIREWIPDFRYELIRSAEERLQCVRKVKERRMGYLFENMEKMSLQEERRKTEEQRKRADTEHEQVEEERKRAEEERKRADEAEEKLLLAEEKLKLLSEKYRLKE